MNRKGDEGSPYLIPLMGLKVSICLPLNKIEKEDVDTHSRTSLTKLGGNLKKIRTSQMKSHSRRS